MPSLSMGPIHLRETQGFQIFSTYDIQTDRFLTAIRYTDHEGRRWVAKPMEWAPVGVDAPKTSLSTPHDGVEPSGRDFLQAALDVAWEIGLRPDGYQDHTNELKATRYHLEDMRALAKVPTR